MIDWFTKLTAAKKDLFILGMFYLIVFILLCPLFFFGTWSKITMGWLFGGIIAFIGFFSLTHSMNSMFGDSKGSEGHAPLWTVALSLLRYVLYAGGLFVSAICTFKPEWFGGFSLLNFYATFVAYLPVPAFLIISNIVSLKKGDSKPAKKAEDSSSEEKK